jgi:hypothetical protein
MLQDKLDLYYLKFGHTFSVFALDLSSPEVSQRLEQLIDAALAGDRGPVTDADLGISVPKDALI